MSVLTTRRYGPVALLLLAGIILSAISFYVVREQERDLVQADLERHTRTRASALQVEIERSVEVLESIDGLYAASVKVERRDFREFVNVHLSRHSEIQALEWIPRVRDSERVSYEEAARTEGLADFQFTEQVAKGQMERAPRRAGYFPVYYVEPLTGNEAAAGFDLASDATRLEALEKARDTGVRDSRLAADRPAQ